MNNNHQYILLSDKPRTGANTEAGFLIIDFFFRNKQTRKKWYKDKTSYHINWTDKNNQPLTSKPINYLEIAKYIRDNGSFNSHEYNLPDIQCFWLDFSLDYKINWHKFDHTAPEGLAVVDGIPQQQYGNNYPIVPKLIREGHSFTTLQPQLLNRIVKMRTELISKSENVLSDDWFFDLRTLINDAVSIVEITMNQIYIKAEYDPLPGWTFDKEKLGSRHGRRFEDKLSWIYKISGNHLGAESYLPSCNNLRELRNHMMHFDPPSLIITVEEATLWLNQIIDIGYLLIKIRQAIGAEVSLQLINFILQKEALFNPEKPFADRLQIGTGNADYASSTWTRQ